MVGAVGLGAPWFLTGWAAGTEVEFMIDTGCQVIILRHRCSNECVFPTLGYGPGCVSADAG